MTFDLVAEDVFETELFIFTFEPSVRIRTRDHFLSHNRRKEAMEFVRKIMAGNQWASFGYIAAEVELKR